MKKIYLLLLLLGFGIGASAQYHMPNWHEAGNPGTLNQDDEYPVGGGLSTTWTSILATTSPSWSPTQTIPFTFQFNGSAVTQYKVSNTGVLTFDLAAGTVPPSLPVSLPNANIPDQSIVIAGLQAKASGDEVVTKTFGTAPNRQHWVFFTSFNYNSGSGSCWTYWSIVLEESTNNIYIVDQRSANCTPQVSIGVQVNATTGISTSVTALAQNDNRPDDNVYYTFAPGPQPAYDLTVEEVDVPSYLALPNAPFDIAGTIRNLGTQTITSFTLNYSVSGGAPVSVPVTGVNISTFGTYNFTHSTKWTPSGLGNYNIIAWASNINGNPDGNTANDEDNKTVEVVAGMYPRKPLIEQFTSSTCGPCNPGNQNVNGVLTAFTEDVNYNIIKYQMSWPGSGDPYFTSEGNSRRNYYGVNSVPWMFTDGLENGNSNGFSDNMLNDALAVPSFVSIDIETAEIDLRNNKITISGELKAMVNFPGSPKLMMAVIENTTYNNVATNGETEFENVVKKMLPNVNGTNVTLQAGDSTSFSQSWTVPGNYRLPNNSNDAINLATEHSIEELDDLSVVVWVENQSTQTVHQSEMAAITAMWGAGIEEAPSAKMNLYPNPANDHAVLNLELSNSEEVDIVIHDMNGRVAYNYNGLDLNAGASNIEIPTAQLANGVYLITIKSDNINATQRMVVQH